MPPIKGRMMGLHSSKMGAGAPQVGQPNLDFRSVKNLGFQSKKSKFCSRGGKAGLMKTVREEQLKKLRIPTKICKSLPSVKKFSNSRDFVDMTDEDDVKIQGVVAGEGGEPILGLKKGRGPENKYHIQALVEKRFNGMVWDLAFNTKSTEIQLLVACGSGVFICDEQLNKKKELDKIHLAGGVGFLSDGRIVALCRFMDVVNVYTSSGEFIHDFSCGKSPMTVAVNSKDEVLVTDCSSKEISFFEPSGTLIRTVASTGKNYNLKWPLYMTVLRNDDFVVADCHQQTVMVFDQQGVFVRSIPMRTGGGSEVLRPHGVCLTSDEDLYVIDNAINTIEVFTVNGTFLQTLLPSEAGSGLRPKIMACNGNGKYGHLAVGGMKGQVRLFKFVEAAEAKLDLVKDEVMTESYPSKVKAKVKTEVKSEVKTEVKMEVKTEDDVTVIVLD